MELKVEFMVIATGVVKERNFDSYRECRNFVLKLKHSKKCQLISYPNVLS